MLDEGLCRRHIQTTGMKKLAIAVTPKPVFSFIVVADLTDRCISPVSEQKILS